VPQLPPDYHMHTRLCHHAVGDPVDLAQRAVELGFTEIGVSEHNPMARDDFDNWRMLMSKLDEYLENLEAARRKFPQLRILAALEVDYLPGQEDWIRDLAGRHSWDYFIGSVHYIDGGWDIDNPAKLDQWRARDAFEVWSAYFDRLTAAAASGLFQIIGHADLPKKFGFRPSQDCRPLFARFLDAAASSGVAVEINTAGLRKDCREMYPSPEFLSMARERGVPLTFGSDAHHPSEVGMDFDLALNLARKCGYTHSVRFEQRRPTSAPLPE
jgi:histidinol-phosphatase (PHP family)